MDGKGETIQASKAISSIAKISNQMSLITTLPQRHTVLIGIHSEYKKKTVRL